MAEYAKTSEITPLIGAPGGDLSILENMTGEDHRKERKSAEEKSLWSDTTSRQKCLLLYVILGQFTTFICASIPAPFLARVVTERSGTVLEATTIVQISICVMACSSAIFGKYQAHIGSRILLITGVSCFGVCQVAFGFLSFINNTKVFIASAITIRAIQGIGQGAYAVATLTIICQEFSDHVGQVFGIAESAVGVGYLTGPMLGSMLFTITGGMLYPFIISGGIVLLMGPIGALILKHINECKDKGEKFKVMDFIGTPGCFLILGFAAAIYGGYGVYNVTVTVYLEKEGFSVINVGLVLFVSSLSYCFVSVAIGYASSSGIQTRRVILALGLIGLAGNTFMFKSNQSQPLIFIAATLFGIFGAFALIACFTELVDLAIKDRPELRTSFALHSTLSGAWNFVLGMGTFIFPLAGSEIEKRTTFAVAMFVIFAGGYMLAFILPTCMAITAKCRGTGKPK